MYIVDKKGHKNSPVYTGLSVIGRQPLTKVN